MSAYVWVSATNAKLKYMTAVPNDPNAPAGYVLTNCSDGSWQGVDGSHDQSVQQYTGGVNSGGYPAYAGDTATSGNTNPNGIVNWR